MATKDAPTQPPHARPVASAASARAPSETMRGVATALICLYLVGLMLCIVGNSASGSSALVRTVKSKLFSPWMVPVWLDLGYDSKLTYGQPEDADHLVEVTLAEGTQDKRDQNTNDSVGERMRFPSAKMRGERAARWRRMAWWIARAEEDPDREGLLPAAMAAGLFDDVGGEDLTIRVLRHLPLERASHTSGDPSLDSALSDEQATGRFEQAYAARVRRVGGEVQLLKAEPKAEVAPLRTAPATR
ncbi:MAG: hypothetical protein WCQ91_00840 [Planctomycetota bacterium]